MAIPKLMPFLTLYDLDKFFQWYLVIKVLNISRYWIVYIELYMFNIWYVVWYFYYCRYDTPHVADSLYQKLSADTDILKNNSYFIVANQGAAKFIISSWLISSWKLCHTKTYSYQGFKYQPILNCIYHIIF